MAKNNGHVPGTYVSTNELNELNNLLSTFRDYILSHEARLELIEGWINEFMAQNSPESEADEAGTEEAEGTSVPLAVVEAELGFESTDDPEEG